MIQKTPKSNKVAALVEAWTPKTSMLRYPEKMHGLSHEYCQYPLKTRWAEKTQAQQSFRTKKPLESSGSEWGLGGKWSFSVLACFLRARCVSAVLVIESSMHRTHHVQVHLSVDFLYLASCWGRIRRWRGSWASCPRGPCYEGSTEVGSAAVDFLHFWHGKQH